MGARHAERGAGSARAVPVPDAARRVRPSTGAPARPRRRRATDRHGRRRRWCRRAASESAVRRPPQLLRDPDPLSKRWRTSRRQDEQQIVPRWRDVPVGRRLHAHGAGIRPHDHALNYPLRHVEPVRHCARPYQDHLGDARRVRSLNEENRAIRDRRWCTGDRRPREREVRGIIPLVLGRLTRLPLPSLSPPISTLPSASRIAVE